MNSSTLRAYHAYHAACDRENALRHELHAKYGDGFANPGRMTPEDTERFLRAIEDSCRAELALYPND